MLDIKNSFQYLFGEHTFPSLYYGFFPQKKSYRKMYAFSIFTRVIAFYIPTQTNEEPYNSVIFLFGK